MKPMTHNDALNKFCPFKFDSGLVTRTCSGNGCMAWNVVHPELVREDHSGANSIVLKEAVRTHRIMRREGPAGSYGKLILDEVGICSRLASE